ncbi:MAG: hypothetical protein PWQ81_169 [Bacteroidota bacterium]|nr:hypothetical protein [Bacteroidota bacterium]
MLAYIEKPPYICIYLINNRPCKGTKLKENENRRWNQDAM